MGPLTAERPKPLLPLRGRPIIEHILYGLQNAGIEEAIVVTGYRGEQIESHLGDGARLGLRLRYRQQPRSEGTARALLLVQDLLGSANFVLTWGDVVIEAPEYADLLKAFERHPCDALLALNRIDDPWRGAAVYADPQWRVTRLIEKPPRGTSTTPWNNSGIFVFTPAIFAYAASLAPSPRGEYELPQAVSAMIDGGCYVRAHPLRGFWSDLGTPQDLELAQSLYPAAPGGGR